jgi:hypothetical protein
MKTRTACRVWSFVNGGSLCRAHSEEFYVQFGRIAYEKLRDHIRRSPGLGENKLGQLTGHPPAW